MDRIHDIKAFIERTQEIYVEELEVLTRSNQEKKLSYLSLEKRKQYQKKYLSTEKGKQASKRRNANRLKRMKEAIEILTPEQLKQVEEFYKKCPKNKCVDHIIPLAKGGTHTVDNLQYLTPMKKAKKAVKLIWLPLPKRLRDRKISQLFNPKVKFIYWFS